MDGTASNNTTWNELQDDASTTISLSIFISLLAFFGLCGNIFLIVCVLKSKNLRCKASSLFTINLFIVCVLDCVVNMTFTISSTVMQSWPNSEQVCSIQAFTIQVVNIELTLNVMGQALNRLFNSKIKSQLVLESRPSSWKTFAFIIYTWIHSLSFCLPLLTEHVSSTFYPSKYYCAIGSGVTLIYMMMLTVLCFVLPFFVIVGIYICVFRMVIKEKSNSSCKGKCFYTDLKISPLSKSSKELSETKLSFTIFLLWVFLCAPFITSNLYEQTRNTKELMRNDDLFKLPNAVDIICLLARFSFPTAVAIVYFTRKATRNTLKALLTCRRNNSVTDLKNPSGLQRSKKSKPRLQLNALSFTEKYSGNSKDALFTPTSFQVPVLFATSNGIHVKKLQNDIADFTGIDFKNTKSPTDVQDFNFFSAEKCDVLGSQSDLIHAEDDTSDYDSSGEVDQFSVSHPITSKGNNSNMIHVIPRSLSNPEVRRSKKNETAKLKTTPVDHYMIAGDSGIDITSNAANSMNRKTRHCVPEVETPTEISLPSAVNSISSVVFMQATCRGSPDHFSTEKISPIPNSCKPELTCTRTSNGCLHEGSKLTSKTQTDFIQQGICTKTNHRTISPVEFYLPNDPLSTGLTLIPKKPQSKTKNSAPTKDSRIDEKFETSMNSMPWDPTKSSSECLSMDKCVKNFSDIQSSLNTKGLPKMKIMTSSPSAQADRANLSNVRKIPPVKR